MAKKGMVEQNKRKQRMVARDAAKRAALKATAKDGNASMEERFQAQLKLAEMPRNGSKVRVVNRCEVSGRPHGYYRKLKMSRIALRDLGNNGQIPGVVKSSW